jgi:hypothetical protein
VQTIQLILISSAENTLNKRHYFNLASLSSVNDCLENMGALNDGPQKHRDRPRTLHTDENCVILEGLIREDRKVKLREIAEVTGIEKALFMKSSEI